MLRRDRVIAALIVIELMGLICFWRWHKQHAGATSIENSILLDVPVSDVVGELSDCLGNPQSPYTLVEFGDYQCPPCARAYPQTYEIASKYPGKLKFNFRHYPLNMHPYALLAANAAEEARRQGKFWQMHEALYKLGGTLDTGKIQAAAQSVGVQTHIAQPGALKVNGNVEQDRHDGNNVGVDSTPTFILCCPDGKIIKLAALSQAERFIK